MRHLTHNCLYFTTQSPAGMCFYSSLLVNLKYDESLFRLTGDPALVCTRLITSPLSVQIQAHQHLCMSKPMRCVCDCESAVVTNTQPLRLWVGLSVLVSAHTHTHTRTYKGSRCLSPSPGDQAAVSDYPVSSLHHCFPERTWCVFCESPLVVPLTLIQAVHLKNACIKFQTYIR